MPRQATVALPNGERHTGAMPARESLTAPEERSWALLTGVMTWLPVELDAFLEREADLSHAEYQVLRWLSIEVDREVHMTHLASTAKVTPSHLSRIVGRLERRELIARSADRVDTRRTLARLTPAGAELVAAVEPRYAAEVRARVFDLLGDGQADALGDALESLLVALRPDCMAAVPPRDGR